MSNIIVDGFCVKMVCDKCLDSARNNTLYKYTSKNIIDGKCGKCSNKVPKAYYKVYAYDNVTIKDKTLVKFLTMCTPHIC